MGKAVGGREEVPRRASHHAADHLVHRIQRRPGQPHDTADFNFELDADRAAIGELLGQISEDAIAETGGLLISALVQYLDANDAGPGFYALARSKGLQVPTTTDDRQLFWASQVEALHKHYARLRRRRVTE